MTKAALKRHALAFLREHSSAVLVTSSSTHGPEAATMYYEVDDEYNFYFMAAAKSRKVKNLTDNPSVAVVVGFGPAAITIQGGGMAELSAGVDLPFFNRVVEKIKLHSLDQLPLLRINRGAYVTIKVKPTRLVWLNLDRAGHPETYHNDFYHLIPPADVAPIQ